MGETQRIGTLTCRLVGHKFVMHEFVQYLEEMDPVTARRERLCTLKRTDYCVRCGIDRKVVANG